MSEHDKRHLHTKLSLALNGVALITISILGYFIYSLSKNISIVENNMSSSTEILSQKISQLEAALATTSLTGQELAQRLLEQQNQSNSFQSTISNIAGTVNSLEKLSKTDKELLQKYSKVYFLSDNYVPMSLTDIDQKYIFDKLKTMQLHTSVLPFLTKMVDQAGYSGVSLKIVSAYRSFGTQSALKNDYLITYGSGANKFSADQGYSEHQLGTTVDLTSEGTKTPLEETFKNSKEYEWLTDNAYKYGFILSYPENNLYYEYEPWHWRFVGVGLATQLHNTNTNFSNMEQREIDKYLVFIFDQM